MQKLRTGKMSINQAYKSIYKESIKKQLQAQQYQPNSVISKKIIANTATTSTTSPTAKLTSHVEIKEGDRLIRSTERSNEGDDIVRENCELKQEIQTLREQSP